MKIKFLLLACIPFCANAQITVDNTDIDGAISDFFIGEGVFVSNITFNGMPFDTTFSQVGYFTAGTSGFPFDMGIIMGTGNVMLAQGPNTSASATNNSGVSPDPNDPDLDAIATFTAYNEAILEFDFIPTGDSVVFEYIFASEEYHEYVNAGVNDVFGFFISGPGISGPYTNMAENIALIPGTSLPVAIDNVNNGSSNTGPCTNCAYFVNNVGGTAIQYDARTTVLTAIADVVCGEVYHMKLAIGDVGDQAWDSGIFLKGSSFISNGLGLSIDNDQAFSFQNMELSEGCDSLGLFLQLPEWAVGTSPVVNITTGGSAIKDVDYIISDTTVTFGPGDTLIPVFIYPTADGIYEPADSILLTLNFLTPCGDTLGIDKVIYLVDLIPSTIAISDVVVTCPGEAVLLEPLITGGNQFDLTTWSTGDTTATINPVIYSDTSFTIQVFSACGLPPVTETVFVDLLSNLGGTVTGPWLCYNDTVVSAYFSGIADSLSWGNDTLNVPYTGIFYYDLQIYDTTYGCVDSLTYQVFLYPTPSVPYIATMADTLVTDTFALYQWYFNGAPIPGANEMTYVPVDTGYYQVEVWDSNGCFIFSDSMYVSSELALAENDEESNFLIYPNPATDFITLEFNGKNENSKVVIYNLAGQVVSEHTTSGLKKMQLNLDDFAPGSYLVSYIREDQPAQTRSVVVF